MGNALAPNLGERDQPAKRAALMLFRSLGRCGVRLAPRSDRQGKTGDVFGETPNMAVGTTALPKHQNSEHSRLFAFIRGFINTSQKTKPTPKSNMLIYFRQQP
jgi:hypothetical protein